MKTLSIAFFHDLRSQLTNPNRKKATWEDVANHCKENNFDIFNDKNSKAVYRRLYDWTKNGIPSHVKVKFIEESDFNK